MKKIIFTLLLTALSSSVFAKNSNIQTIVIETQIYCDHCLQCGSCGNNININVRSNKGIKKVKIDAKANTITVDYDANKIHPDAIRKTINNAGYDADDMKAPAESVAKLDGCCRKH
ncbi:MAG TPA: heavy-metal-associated domain-containing protein [Chitinophagales bacterium]|nr:heavy-metal-associated domain-containing protein [Chitinophagales bacterium]